MNTDSLFAFNRFFCPDSSGHIALQWEVSNDGSINTYIVGRGADTGYFNNLSTIPSVRRNSKQVYNYTDAVPLNGQNYYKIQITDTTGNNRFSKILSIDFRLVNTTLYPNPAYDFVNVSSPVSTIASVIKLIDPSGKLIRQVSGNANTVHTRLNLTGVSPGMYTIFWTDGNVKISNQLSIR